MPTKYYILLVSRHSIMKGLKVLLHHVKLSISTWLGLKILSYWIFVFVSWQDICSRQITIEHFVFRILKIWYVHTFMKWQQISKIFLNTWWCPNLLHTWDSQITLCACEFTMVWSRVWLAITSQYPPWMSRDLTSDGSLATAETSHLHTPWRQDTIPNWHPVPIHWSQG